jgi:hypothetical protein
MRVALIAAMLVTAVAAVLVVVTRPWADESAPPPDAPAAVRLRWAPPRLVDPITVKLGGGETVTEMDPARDYVVVLPHRRKVGATVLKGGHNVVVKGGWITIPPGAPSGADRSAVYVKGATGTVHLEGLLIDGSGGGVGDGIVIAAPGAVVQIENVRVVGLRGSYREMHADVVQPWGGVRELRIDRLTGSSNYQGLTIQPDLGPIGQATVDHANLRYTGTAPADGGYLIWLTSGASSCQASPVTLFDVYVEPKRGRSLGNSVWPPARSPLGCGATVRRNAARWHRLPARGAVLGGAPPDGDFVPAGVAGVRYRSPGYAR